MEQRTLTLFLRGSITVQLTSCLTGLDLTKFVNFYLIQHKQSSLGQPAGQPYSDTSPYEESDCSLDGTWVMKTLILL